MKDHPSYGRIRGTGGPRTKKQLRWKRNTLARLKKQERYASILEERLEKERRMPTLHDVGWKP